MSEELPDKWKNVLPEQWNDWKWQMRNRITTCKELAEIINLDDAEKDLDDAEEDLDNAEGGKLESFNSFIRKRR